MSGDAEGDNGADAELAAATLQAVANPYRIQLLTGLHEGRSRPELVDQLPISESGVSNHLRTLADAGLVYRTEDGWQVSPLGTFFADLLDELVPLVAEAQRRIESAQAEAREEYTDVPLPEQERDRTVEWRTWDLVRDELEDLLAGQVGAVGAVDEPADESDG